MGSGRKVRDFVYLDFERVRSFVAQALGGVADERVYEKTHDMGGEAKGGGGIPGVVHGSGALDYRYVRSEQETRSLHHYVFSQLEDHLAGSSMVSEIDDGFDFASWDESLFVDGRFVRVTGLVRILDYEWLATQFDVLPTMFKTLEQAMTISLTQRKAEGKLDDAAYKRERAKLGDPGKQIREFKLDKFSALLKQVYGDMIRIKMLPSLENPKKLFACSATRALFTDSPAVLIQKYGYSKPPRWTMLGQINRGEAVELPVQMSMGNTMEDAFEQVALGFGKLLETTVSVAFPAVAVTPIAIYRHIMEG